MNSVLKLTQSAGIRQLRWEEKDYRKCASPVGLWLKIPLSCTTVVLLALLVLQFRLRTILLATKEILADSTRMKSLFTYDNHSWVKHITSKELGKLVLELFLCSVHPIPGYLRDYRVQLLGSTYYYRFESIMCAAMLPRLYHLARWLQLATLYRYFDLDHTYTLQDDHTIGMIRESVVSPKKLSLKVR